MDLFCLLWLTLAVQVSCQEVSIDVCTRNEVNFTCVIRGSPNLTSLILAWSSPEYIGQGDALRFTTATMPGMNSRSVINGNVTAILTRNTVSGIDRVPELVSVLHIVGASQSSLITCSSVTNGSFASAMFDSSAFPGKPQNVRARELLAGSCDILITWNPSDGSDVDHYVIYVTSQKNMDAFSTTTVLNVPDCRVGNNSIQVAAVNNLGCVGPNSSLIPLNLSGMPTEDVVTSPSLIIGAVTTTFTVFTLFVVVVFIIIQVYKYCRKKRDAAKKNKGNFAAHFDYFIKAIIGELDSNSKLSASSDSLIPILTRGLLEMMKKVSPSDIKEALMTTLFETQVISARGIQHTLLQLKLWIPDVIIIFDTQLKTAGSSVTIDKLIEPVKEGNYQKVGSSVTMIEVPEGEKKLFDELKRKMDESSPEAVKDHLQNFFEVLKDSFDAKEGLLQELKEEFALYLVYWIKAIRESHSTRKHSASLVPTFSHELLEKMKKIPPSNIKEALMTTVFETEVLSTRGIQETLDQLKEGNPNIMSTFDSQLRIAGSSVTIDKLIAAAKEGNHKELFDELKEQVDKAPSEAVKDHLQTLFQALEDRHDSHASRSPLLQNLMPRAASHRRVSRKEVTPEPPIAEEAPGPSKDPSSKQPFSKTNGSEIKKVSNPMEDSEEAVVTTVAVENTSL